MKHEHWAHLTALGIENRSVKISNLGLRRLRQNEYGFHLLFSEIQRTIEEGKTSFLKYREQEKKGRQGDLVDGFGSPAKFVWGRRVCRRGEGEFVDRR